MPWSWSREGGDGGLSRATAEVYARDVQTFVRLTRACRLSAVLDDLAGDDVDAVLLAFARKLDERRRELAEGGGAAERGVAGAVPALGVGAVQACRADGLGAASSRWPRRRWWPRSAGVCGPSGGRRPGEQAQGLIGAAAARRRRRRGGVAISGRRCVRADRAAADDGGAAGLGAGPGQCRGFLHQRRRPLLADLRQGGKTRDVPLPRLAADVLAAYLEVREGRGQARCCCRGGGEGWRGVTCRG